MRAKFTIEVEASKDEINEFADNISSFVKRKRGMLLDVKPVGGYVPHFNLPPSRWKGYPNNLR